MLFGLVALFWFILPFWQIFGGVFEGGEAFIGCWFFAGLFFTGGVALFFCYRVTRAGKLGDGARALIWGFVSLAGLIGSAMALRIISLFLP